MRELEDSYDALKTCSDLWRWALAHVLFSALIPLSMVDFAKHGAWPWITTEYLLPPISFLWLITLGVVVRRLMRFHSDMRTFLARLSTARKRQKP